MKIKLSAFTLAEVLITLGIIGIVAALTIPTLMNKIQDYQYTQAAKKLYSEASQVVAQMKLDNGGTLSSYYTKAGSFEPIFRTYFKDAKPGAYVAKSGCQAVGYKTLHNDTYDIYTWGCWVDEGQFKTPDGVFWGIENSGVDIAISVDVNGETKGPNMAGRDLFMFQLINDNLLPMGTQGTSFTDLCTRNTSATQQGLSCMYNVMQGIDY